MSGTEGTSGKIVNPRWSMDGYLVPNPDTIILHDVNQVLNLDTDKTVVVVNAPGTSVEFKKCNIGGGVVMWAPKDWPQRGPARNEVTWSSSNFGTDGGGTGTYRHIGMLAPASRLAKANSSNPGTGLFYFHEIDHMNNATINGAVYVVNGTGSWNNVDVNYLPGLGTADFLGMEARVKIVELVEVTEYHPVVPQKI